MLLEARPDLPPAQRVMFFDAALADVRAELLAGATRITADADGDSIVIRSDRLAEPKVIRISGGE